MDYSHLVYGLAIAWFTYHVFWMLMRIYQFSVFPRTYGLRPNVSLRDLASLAESAGTELPAFRIVVPAYQEAAVIEGTIRRLVAMNYPRTHFTIHVVVYVDEPQDEQGQTTRSVVERVAQEINHAAQCALVQPLVVPADYDGFFPGSLSSRIRHIGKARGLNYALRVVHQHNERDERLLYIGRMHELGHADRIEKTLEVMEKRLRDEHSLEWTLETVFNPESPEYLGPLVYSSQLLHVWEVCARYADLPDGRPSALELMLAYVESEAPRFYMTFARGDSRTAGRAPGQLSVMADKRFLSDVMQEVEGLPATELAARARRRMKELERTRPLLSTALYGAGAPGELYESTKRCNARWLMVYDADADAPLDVMRHLAARILTEPATLGFQGPIAPLLNYDDVHSICRMGAMWMAFWHGAAYPRLLNNPGWAHPLAGTNWCFHIEGFEHDGRMIRDCPYEEGKRRFLLQFDPRQLTEDLEAGLRLYDRWRVNAAWLPVVEMEQVPPTAGAMFSQHSRWALGTLQTLGYIIGSGLPWTQKTWFMMYPLRVIFASSGPFITVGLISAMATGWLVVEPIFAWWTIGLIFANAVYVWAFVKTFERYYDMRMEGEAVEYVHRNAPQLLAAARARKARARDLQGHLSRMIAQLERELQEGGFITRELARRCTEPEPARAGEPAGGYLERLEAATPTRLRATRVQEVVAELETSLEASGNREQPAGAETTDGHRDELDRLAELVENAATRAGVNRPIRWSRYHNQILIWAIPFIYFSVTPFFKAFWLWMKGEQREWNKTVRTPKNYDAAHE